MFSAHRLFQAGALAAVLASSACAAQNGYYRYPTTAPRGVDDRAYTRGYDEGRSRGENDGRRNRPFDYARYDEYRDGDSGYRGSGDRNGYRSLFRQGFVSGYNDGYRRYAGGGYGNSAPRYPVPRNGSSDTYPNARYRSVASESGYRDGYEQGTDDARRGNRFDPIRSSRYRSGDHDYNSRYGSRDDYKRDYRTAFQNGYDQGYRGYRR
jgi:hypothetical protein